MDITNTNVPAGQTAQLFTASKYTRISAIVGGPGIVTILGFSRNIPPVGTDVSFAVAANGAVVELVLAPGQTLWGSANAIGYQVAACPIPWSGNGKILPASIVRLDGLTVAPVMMYKAETYVEASLCVGILGGGGFATGNIAFNSSMSNPYMLDRGSKMKQVLMLPGDILYAAADPTFPVTSIHGVFTPAPWWNELAKPVTGGPPKKDFRNLKRTFGQRQQTRR